jgi:phenylacetate-CoA ligase
VIQNAFAYGLWVAGLSCHYASARLGATVIPVGANLATERQVAYLIDAKSDVLLSTPSFALYLAERLQESGVDPASLNLSLGCFGGEPGAENVSTRSKLEHGLGIQAFDYYGLAEVAPTFASECEHQTGIHFAEDHVLVECVDPDTHAPLPEGELGTLVFTTLTREATPVLRYLSNDYARLTSDPCECGRTHVRAVGGIVGRHDDLVVFKGAKFYPGQVEKVIRADSAFSDEFRVEISRAAVDAPVAGCVVVVEHAAGAEAEGAVTALEAALRTELGVRVSVRLEPYGTLERTTFKARRLVEVPAADLP